MMAHELLDRARTLCRHRRIGFPSDLPQYAHQWQREQFDLEFCWRLVKPMVASGQPLWRADVDIRRHHDRLQPAQAAKDLKAAPPTPHADRQWDSEGHQQTVPPPALACGTPDDLDGLSAERHRSPRQPYRKRTDTKAHKVRELLKAKVIRGGPIEVVKLELIAKGGGLLGVDQEISRSSTFRRVMKELDIESHRIGFGPGAEYVWRLKPPAWTRGLDVHE